MTSIHERFEQFLKHNLRAVDKISKLPFYALYSDFAKLKWNRQWKIDKTMRNRQ